MHGGAIQPGDAGGWVSRLLALLPLLNLRPCLLQGIALSSEGLVVLTGMTQGDSSSGRPVRSLVSFLTWDTGDTVAAKHYGLPGAGSGEYVPFQSLFKTLCLCCLVSIRCKIRFANIPQNFPHNP